MLIKLYIRYELKGDYTFLSFNIEKEKKTKNSFILLKSFIVFEIKRINITCGSVASWCFSAFVFLFLH